MYVFMKVNGTRFSDPYCKIPISETIREEIEKRTPRMEPNVYAGFSPQKYMLYKQQYSVDAFLEFEGNSEEMKLIGVTIEVKYHYFSTLTRFEVCPQEIWERIPNEEKERFLLTLCHYILKI